MKLIPPDANRIRSILFANLEMERSQCAWWASAISDILSKCTVEEDAPTPPPEAKGTATGEQLPCKHCGRDAYHPTHVPGQQKRHDFEPDAPPPPAALPVTYYLASRTRHAHKWRALRETGVRVLSTWIDEAEPGESLDLSDLAERCIQEAATADRTILYAEPDDTLKGALMEAGAALAAGKEVVCVGECPSLKTAVASHPRWRTAATVEEALVMPFITTPPVAPPPPQSRGAGEREGTAGEREAAQMFPFVGGILGNADRMELRRRVAATIDRVAAEARREGERAGMERAAKIAATTPDCDCGRIEHGRHHTECPAYGQASPTVVREDVAERIRAAAGEGKGGEA